MEKIIKIFLFAILASVLYQVGFALIHANQGDTVTVQSRFTKVENGKKVFNWAGVLSPIQVTAFKTNETVTNFTERVTYPVAPKFDLVAPSDSKEDVVASKISRVIQDSLRKITYNNALNYDGTSFAVLQASGDSMPVVSKPQIVLSLIGTASPEAKKYGFRESLAPGHFEVENQKLSDARLDRTKNLLSQKLANTNFRITKTEAKEIQLKSQKEVDSVVANPTLLNAMRYVEAQVQITSQNVKVIPCPSPILLLLWLGLLYFLLSSLSRIKWAEVEPTVPATSVQRVRAIAPVEEPKEEVYNFNFIWFLLGAGILYILYQVIGWRAFLIAGIFGLAWAIYYFLKKKDVIVYTPKPVEEEQGERKIPTHWIWIWVGVAILLAVLFSQLLLAIGQLFLLYEAFRWILFIIVMCTLAYVVYFYEKQIFGWFREWELPKVSVRKPIVKFGWMKSVLISILIFIGAGLIWFWWGIKALLGMLIVIILILIGLFWYFLPRPILRATASFFREKIIWIRFMAISWWHWSPRCCKILLALIIFIIISRALGWWIWTGPWFW